MDAEQLSTGLLWGLAFIFSTTCHEAAHAWAALRGGDDTAYLGGQVTLNPWPHIKRSPFGMVVIPLISFIFSGFMIGWASTPYDPAWANRYPHRSARMSLAGPAANFSIAILCLVILKIGASQGLFFVGEESSIWFPVQNLFTIAFLLNLILGVFNLIPLPPLDGAEAILLFFPEAKAHLVREKLAMLGIFGLFIAWMVFRQIAGPLFAFARFMIELII